MGKNEIYWAIFSGVTMLPFTIRTTRWQCKQDYLRDRRRDYLREHETCRKVVINEFLRAR
jgi:hypothetical protein